MSRTGRPKELKEAVRLQVIVEKSVKDLLERIAEREHKSVSELLRGEVEDYAKAHAHGNSQFSLDMSIQAPEFHALPTIWREPTSEALRDISKEDRESMVSYMEKWYSAIDKNNRARGWG